MFLRIEPGCVGAETLCLFGKSGMRFDTNERHRLAVSSWQSASLFSYDSLMLNKNAMAVVYEIEKLPKPLKDLISELVSKTREELKNVKKLAE